MDYRPNANRTFTKFQRHIDNANETISASDINKVQKSVNTNEDDIAALKNERFMDKVLFSFDNNLYVNSLFSDDYGDLRNVDIDRCKNIEHNTSEMYIAVSDGEVEAEVYTSKIRSTLGDTITLNDFFLVTDEYCPHGTKIVHYLITDHGEVYPIEANGTKTPCSIHGGVTGAVLKSVLIKNVQGETPKLYGVAVSFFDEGVEAQYGLLHPDISRFEQSTFGTTTLIRDKAQEDKLVKVIEPNATTNLTYQSDGRLKVVEMLSSQDDIRVQDELNYGDYENSKGEVEDLLLSITTIQSRKQREVAQHENGGAEQR